LAVFFESFGSRIKRAKNVSAVNNKNYTVRNTGRSAIAAAIVTQVAPGKAGELLIRQGFNQMTFATFLANLATRAITAGYDEKKLAELFRQMAAGNASQARQALEEVAIKFDGDDKEQSLSTYWSKHFPSSVAVDTTELDKL
jgi:hypothetical protein